MLPQRVANASTLDKPCSISHYRLNIILDVVAAATRICNLVRPFADASSLCVWQEERESFGRHLLQQGFKDAFREMYPDVVGYTYWNYRTNARVPNRGWRLDYCLVMTCPHFPFPCAQMLYQQYWLHWAEAERMTEGIMPPQLPQSISFCSQWGP